MLLSQYKEVSQILLSQSLLLPHIQYDVLQAEEVEELEVTEKGISMVRFREYSADLLLKTYLLLQSEYKEQGEQLIYQLLIDGLNAGIQANKPEQAEVCFFGLRSIFDGMDDLEWNKSTLNALSAFFEFISQPKIQPSFTLTRACLQSV